MQYNNAIDKFITYQLEPHDEVESQKYHDSMVWIKDNVAVAQVHASPKHRYFYVSEDIWNMVSSMFSLDHFETEKMLKLWLEKNYGLYDMKPELEYVKFLR